MSNDPEQDVAQPNGKGVTVEGNDPNPDPTPGPADGTPVTPDGKGVTFV
jgi:hypothetical protein